MKAWKKAAIAIALLPLAGLMASCAHPAKPEPQAVAVSAAPPAPAPASAATVPVQDQHQLGDERRIAAAQKALTALGYNTGKADGKMGPATRRAIQAFQRDHGLAEDGQLTFALAGMLGNLVAQLPKSTSITVAAGDSVIFSDGTVDSAPHLRVVDWDQESRGIVAVRPSTAGWPPAARAGLEWATTHALDEADGAVVQWSSTGVAQHFEIQVFPALSAHEAAIAGANPSCRRFELQVSSLARHFPGLACKDAKGDWVLPHTHIRLARPATALGSSPLAAASRP